MKELRIIVAGSRTFKDYEKLSDTLMEYLGSIDGSDLVDDPSQVKFISGTARGADTLGEQFDYAWGYDVIRFPANWDTYGKSAGYRRNADMAKYASEKNGVLFAFWDGRSRGTKSMIDLGNRYGLEVHVIEFE